MLSANGALKQNFNSYWQIPESKVILDYVEIETLSFEDPIDSSNTT
jgi:hypothetical protein